ncbi:MAG: Fic family protein [Alphaproteobacteria bacterium]|nr:Fic family protein [Alphaproteobacteria bacterium]
MPRIKDIIITPDMLNKIAEIDKFVGSWYSDALKLSQADLKVMKRVATIESVGSSNRIEGNKMTDAEIEELFSHINQTSFKSRDEEEVAGYSELINTIFENYDDIPLTENYIKQLHQILLKYSSKDERHRGEYKTDSNRVAAYDVNGKEIGTIFETATPFDTPRLMRELIQWTNDTFEDHFLHPIITIGIFVVHFLSIHPFIDGNGRMSRALTVLLMLKNKYGYMPYASMESMIEANKDAYYRALRGTQKTIWTDKVDYEPWLTFFITSLQKQKRLLESKIQKLHNSNEDRLPTTAREILDLFINKSELDMAEIIQLTGKKSETVRKSVQGLVKKGFLVKQGTTKGVSYTFNKD